MKLSDRSARPVALDGRDADADADAVREGPARLASRPVPIIASIRKCLKYVWPPSEQGLA